MIPASISYWESPMTIRFVIASGAISPYISYKDINASFFHSFRPTRCSNSALAEMTGMYFEIKLCTFGSNILDEYSTHPLFALVIIITLDTLRKLLSKIKIWLLICSNTAPWLVTKSFISASLVGSRKVVGNNVSS